MEIPGRRAVTMRPTAKAATTRVRRNPLLALPAMGRIFALDRTTRVLLAAILLDLRREARLRAQRSWAKHKAPMAAYWAAVGVYAGHLARCLAEGREVRQALLQEMTDADRA